MDVTHIVEGSDEAHKDDSPSEKVLCRACLLAITSREEQFEKNGRREHCFFNPHGVAFVLSCYRKANGCRVFGEPSTEFSWFKGYEWSYGACRQCGEHLGWFFQAPGGEGFFGLISEKLIDDKG